MCISINLFIRSLGVRACMYIIFMDYIHNENTTKNIDLLRDEIIVLIDKTKSQRTLFKFNVFKLSLSRQISFYEYTYPKYSSYLADFKIIAKQNDNNNDIFVEEFKTKVNNCDDLFVLYLFYDYLKGAYSRYELEINDNK